ncbi:MAG: hypothetical protein IKS20_05490, partial [Victivallales bacterium]|nr:hypothetical protein [Victivallales bacterium]
MKNIILAALLFACCAFAVENAPLPGRVLRVSFDKDGAVAEAPSKSLAPISAPDKPTMVPGREGGFAYRLAKGDKQLRFPAAGIAKPTAGTISIWAKAENFEPYNKEHRGWSIKPITLYNLHLVQGGKWMSLRTVIYRGADDRGIRTYLNTSEPPQRFGAWASLPIPLGLVHQGEWHLFTCTWTTENVEVYLDGIFIANCILQANKAKVLPLLKSPNAKQSYLAIRGDGKEQSLERGEHTDVGELTLFDRVLSPAEIRSLYLAGPDGWPKQDELVSIEAGGAFMNGRESVRLLLDFTMLERYGKHGGRREAQWTVASKGSGDVLKKGTVRWAAEDTRPSLYVFGLERAGDYEFHLEYPGEPSVKMAHSFSKPDTSWVGNQIGRDDTTPKPWIAPQWGGPAKVQVWNRVYDFTGSAFPRQVTANGSGLLSEPVVLKVSSQGREANTTARIEKSSLHGSFAQFEGTLEDGRDFRAAFQTTVDFDGFVHAKVTCTQKCKVEALSLDWSVAEGFRDYLLTPRPAEKEQGGETLLGRNTRQAWLVSEKGGFCWMADNGRNWVNKAPEKCISISRKTGRCRLDIIDKPVEIPSGTTWNIFFIATPTRPPMENHRTWRAMNGGKNGCAIVSGGFQDGGYLLLDEEKVRNLRKPPVERGLALYASAEFLYSINKEASWFFRDWLGHGYFYGMGAPNSISLPSCIGTCKADYLIDCAARSLKMPAFEYVDGFYFDCTVVGVCLGKMHGCATPDSFGRTCGSSTLLPLRDFMKRMCRLLYPIGRHIGAHGQYSFCPGVHGLCDYWLSGEELRGTVMSKGAGLYCDLAAVSNEHLRVTADSRVLCNVNVLEIPYVKNRKSKAPDPNEPGGVPGLTRFVAEDIKACWASDSLFG